MERNYKSCKYGGCTFCFNTAIFILFYWQFMHISFIVGCNLEFTLIFWLNLFALNLKFLLIQQVTFNISIEVNGIR